MFTNAPGNPGTRVTDLAGLSPRRGEVSAYARAMGLARIVVRGRLQSGQLHVGDDGLIYPRPEPSVAFKQPPTPEPLPPTWEGKCAAFGTLSERMIADRPDGKSAEDAAGDLNCQVRLALGAVMRGDVS